MPSSLARLLSISICVGSTIFLMWACILLLPNNFFVVNQPFGGYYSKQARSFLSGRTDVDPHPPSKLLQIENPYDYKVHTAISSEAKIDIWDHSFYRGKFYLYFGVAPALLLYTPYRAVTGTDLRDGVALCFLLTMVLFGFWRILARLTTLSEVSIPSWVRCVSLIVLTTSSIWPVLLSRARTYEIPLASAIAFSVWGIWFLLSAFGYKGLKVSCLALASLCFGLAVASRPHYLISSGLALLWIIITFRKDWMRRLTILFALTLPILIVTVGLGVYNYVRFDDFLEFGARYQLGTTDLRHIPFFKTSRFLSGLYIVLLHPLLTTHTFPFLLPERSLPSWAQQDRIFIEHPFGYLFIAPWLFIAIFFFLRTLTTENWPRKEVRQVCLVYCIFAIIGLSNLFMSSIWIAAIDRYTAEFAFYFSALGLIILIRAGATHKRLTRNIILGIIAFFAVYGCVTAHVLTYQWITDRRNF